MPTSDPQLVSNLAEFIEYLSANRPKTSEVDCFRGHESNSYELSPSVFRTLRLRRNEHLMFRDLLASHPSEFEKDTTTLEQLVRVQHYSLPTRLLDMTWNPLVALYFATAKVNDDTLSQDGEVIIVRSKRSSLFFFDSDTVSCISNLALLSYSLKQQIDTSLPLDQFNESLPIKRLTHHIRGEKPQFLPEIVPSDLDRILLVKPKHSNKRILAQSGAFLLFGLHVERTPEEDNGFNIIRLVVPAKAKRSLRRELNVLSINESTMFPEIERAAAFIKSSLPRVVLFRRP